MIPCKENTKKKHWPSADFIGCYQKLLPPRPQLHKPFICRWNFFCFFVFFDKYCFVSNFSMVVSYYKHPGEVLYRQKETYTRDSLTFKQARAKYIWISESLFFSNDDSVPVAAPYSSCRFLLICKYLLVVWRECKRNFFVKATPFARDGQFFKKQKYAVWVTGRIWGAHIDPNPIPPPFSPPWPDRYFEMLGWLAHFHLVPHCKCWEMRESARQ